MDLLRILTGQTASGKASVAVCLAQADDAELISVDSMKVYRDLDVGTAKPSRAVREVVQFHLVDVVDQREDYTVARYVRDARIAADGVAARGRQAIFVGGTPLYLRALLYGIFDGPDADWTLRETLQRRAESEGLAALYEELARVDPVTAARLHPNDQRRIIRALEVMRTTGKPLSSLQREYPAPTPVVDYCMVALRRSEDDLRARIDRRTEVMFARGLVAEARAAAENGLNRSARKAIGYKEALAYLQGKLSEDEMKESVKRNTWRLARKQRTWLKSFPNMHWLDVTPHEPSEETAGRVRDVFCGAGMRN